MIRNRISYWSCSKFADFLRGEKKPYALTLEEWDAWKSEQRSKKPIRFWLSEKFLNKLQNFLFFPYDIYKSLEIYWYNRFISKTHFLKTGLKPGQYHELDTRILFGLFNELKDFVEIELAHMQTLQNNDFKFEKGRSSKAGLAHLDWASELKIDYVDKDHPEYNQPSEQAKTAVIIKKLYSWWINRDDRPDPYDLSGWTENYNKEDKEKRFESHKELQIIEEKYDNEDTEMLLELIKIRKHLWT
jgi:hypothetical protein